MLRRMTTADSADVARIFKEGWPFGPTPSDNQIASKLQKWLVAEQYADPYLVDEMPLTEDAGFMSTLIAEQDGAIVGVIRWQLTGLVCVVHSLVVDPAKREQGIYKLMRNEGIEFMKNLGLTGIKFKVMPDVVALGKDMESGKFETVEKYHDGKCTAQVAGL